MLMRAVLLRYQAAVVPSAASNRLSSTSLAASHQHAYIASLHRDWGTAYNVLHLEGHYAATHSFPAPPQGTPMTDSQPPGGEWGTAKWISHAAKRRDCSALDFVGGVAHAAKGLALNDTSAHTCGNRNNNSSNRTECVACSLPKWGSPVSESGDFGWELPPSISVVGRQMLTAVLPQPHQEQHDVSLVSVTIDALCDSWYHDTVWTSQLIEKLVSGEWSVAVELDVMAGAYLDSPSAMSAMPTSLVARSIATLDAVTPDEQHPPRAYQMTGEVDVAHRCVDASRPDYVVCCASIDETITGIFVVLPEGASTSSTTDIVGNNAVHMRQKLVFSDATAHLLGIVGAADGVADRFLQSIRYHAAFASVQQLVAAARWATVTSADTTVSVNQRTQRHELCVIRRSGLLWCVDIGRQLDHRLHLLGCDAMEEENGVDAVTASASCNIFAALAFMLHRVPMLVAKMTHLPTVLQSIADGCVASAMILSGDRLVRVPPAPSFCLDWLHHHVLQSQHGSATKLGTRVTTCCRRNMWRSLCFWGSQEANVIGWSSRALWGLVMHWRLQMVLNARSICNTRDDLASERAVVLTGYVVLGFYSLEAALNAEGTIESDVALAHLAFFNSRMLPHVPPVRLAR